MRTFVAGAKLRHFWLLIAIVAAAGFAPLSSAQEDAQGKQMRELDWKLEPAVGNIAGKATVPLTGGLRFLDSGPTDKFMALTGNLPRKDSYLLGRIEERQVRTDERVQQLASRADVEALSVIVQRHEHRWQRMIGAACALGAVSGGVAGWIVQALSGGTP